MWGEERGRQDRANRWQQGLGIGCHHCVSAETNVSSLPTIEMGLRLAISSTVRVRMRSTKCELMRSLDGYIIDISND